MNKPTGEAELAAAHGSEAATKISLPKRCIRLVLQLEDTPQNRHTIMLAQGYIRAISRPIDGDIAILKREEITILEHGRPTPPLNAPGERRRADDVGLA